MEAFIIKTRQLIGLTISELQLIWDKLVSTEGTHIFETLKELNPEHTDTCSIKDYAYLGVLVSSNSTFFTDDIAKLKGNIVNVQKLLKEKMKPFIIETKQLKNLSKEDLQKVWDILKSTDGTSIFETIKELNPKHITAVSINDFPYLGVSTYSNDTVFSNHSLRLKGEILNINELLGIPAYMSILVDKVPHVHEKLIKAWAEGAQIQAFNDGKWEDCLPLWNEYVQYRVKPKGTFSSLIILENNGEYSSQELEEILGQYYPEAEINLDIDEQNIILKFEGIVDLEEILGQLPELYITFKELNVTFN